MFAADFEYYRAGSVAEARQLLAAHPGAKLLAGGHSLIPLLKLRLAAPAAVIDIGRIGELRGISNGNGALRIGPLATHAAIAASADVKTHAAALAEAAGQVGDPAVRNRGTIGGNVAHADPASDLPTVFIALGATFTISSPDGERSVSAADFFQGMMATALGEHDILTAVHVPRRGSRHRHRLREVRAPGVALRRYRRGRRGDGRRRHLHGGDGHGRRRDAGPGALHRGRAGVDRSDALSRRDRRGRRAAGGDLGDDLLGDVFASADYRKAVTPVYVQRAITTAAERAA